MAHHCHSCSTRCTYQRHLPRSISKSGHASSSAAARRLVLLLCTVVTRLEFWEKEIVLKPNEKCSIEGIWSRNLVMKTPSPMYPGTSVISAMFSKCFNIYIDSIQSALHFQKIGRHVKSRSSLFVVTKIPSVTNFTGKKKYFSELY